MVRWKVFNLYSILALVQMGLLFYLSTHSVNVAVVAFSLGDKLVHLVVYGVLASLIYLALQEMNVDRRYLLVAAFAVSFFYGVSNEIRQYFIPWRQAELFDVMANGIGAFFFPLGLSLKDHYRKTSQTDPAA